MRPPSTPTDGAWPPDYISVYDWREAQLEKLKDKEYLTDALAYYAEHPVEFINHWVDTYDPRNAMGNVPTRLPLILFQRQAEMVEFILGCLDDQESGAIDKSRDTGATWVACAVSVWLWLFKPGASIGWGSRKQDLVDHIGVPDSIFEKIRRLIVGLPKGFHPAGFDAAKHLSFMRIINPANEASITGEVGDDIGRGGRKLIYFKDESAHYEHPESIEAALSENTNVQIDISTHMGVGTIFYRKTQNGVAWERGKTFPKGATRLFVLDWRDHPAKTQEWHDTREKKWKADGLIHVFRQEVDRDAAASLTGIIIPAYWVRAAIDAHLKLKLPESGGWSGALDVADEGGDLNALTFRKGIVLKYAEAWGEGDTGETTRRTVVKATEYAPVTIQYDCIGVGAGVKAEQNRLLKEKKMPRGIYLMPWDAGESVKDPKKRVVDGDPNSPLNEDFYANLKAQGWWALRRRFEKTYRMVMAAEGKAPPGDENIRFPADELISISSEIEGIHDVERELSQPTIGYTTGTLKIIVDKKPEGARSPNKGDSIMMNYFPVKLPMRISDEAMRVLERA